MLCDLTERLIRDEVKDNENNLLIEGTMLGENLSDIKRYSCSSDECCDEHELMSFKDKLVSVTFPDDMSVDDRKQLLLDTVKNKTVINEDINNINEKLKNYRIQYINACKNKNEDNKQKLITKIKQLEQIRTRRNNQ